MGDRFGLGGHGEPSAEIEVVDRSKGQVDASWSQLPFGEHPPLVVTDRPGHPLTVCLLALFLGAQPVEVRWWSYKVLR